MREIVTPEETGESEIGEQIIRFPELKDLIIEGLLRLESFYVGKSKLEFPKLKELQLYHLLRMKSFAKLENPRALFHEMISFPCLENLRVEMVSDEVSGLWDLQASSVMPNPSPMLRQLTLDSSAGLRNIPSIILKNLSSLGLVNCDNDDAIFSLSDVQTNVGFVRRYSELPTLEKLKVDCCVHLKELIKMDECNGDEALKFCGQLKTLELRWLATLKLIPLHLFKGLESLTLFEIRWKYVVSAEKLGDSLQQLQFLQISSCDDIKYVIDIVSSAIELPCLKELVLSNLDSIESFSFTTNEEATLHLPSLESLEISGCRQLKHFWSGSIKAPRLQRVKLWECNNVQQLLVGNTEHLTEFSYLQQVVINECPNMKSLSSRPLNTPKLQQVVISRCPNMKSFSSGTLNAPNLRQVELNWCHSMEWFLQGNPNDDGVLQLPSLEVVVIKYSNLHSFSPTPLVAPKLTHVKYNEVEYSILALPDDNLNCFLKEMIAKYHDSNHSLMKIIDAKIITVEKVDKDHVYLTIDEDEDEETEAEDEVAAAEDEEEEALET